MRDDQRFSSKKQEELTETFNREGGIRGTCGEERGQDHKQYYGNWFCPKTATQSEEEWRTEVVEKRKNKKT